MDIPTPHRDFSVGRSEASERSPSLDSPEPATVIVPCKRRRNSGARGNTVTGGGRVHKRSAGRGVGNSSSRVAAGALAAAATNGDGGPFAVENLSAGNSNNSGGSVATTTTATRPIELEPITEDMTEDEKRQVQERNDQAEAAYNDDRRRNNQSAKRSRLKKEMYMVEMDMAIKSYRRNVLEYKQAYETARTVLVRHNLFSEAELGVTFKEPELWKRPLFMAEQENDIADHRSKLERAALQADLPKLGLDFADKVYELVGRTVPLADKDSAVKALAEHHQKIEDCERKQYQLLLQLHEFERKMEETRAKMLDQQRRKQELDMAAEKYKHIGYGEEDGQVACGGDGVHVGKMVKVAPLLVPDDGMDMVGLQDHQCERDDDLFVGSDSKTMSLPIQTEREQGQPPTQQIEGNSRPPSRGKEGDNSGRLNPPPLVQVVPPTTKATAVAVAEEEEQGEEEEEERDEEIKAFFDEIDEFLQSNSTGMIDSMDSTIMIKPDLFDMDGAMFGGLPGTVVDFGSDDVLLGQGQGQQQQQQFLQHQHQAQAQGFVLSGTNGSSHVQQQRHLSSPISGASVHTVVGPPAILGSDGVNPTPFSSPVFGTRTIANWPGVHHLGQSTATIPVSPPTGQGIFLGNSSSNATDTGQQHQHQHQTGQVAWPIHPQYHHPHGHSHPQQAAESVAGPVWHPHTHAQPLVQAFDDGYIDMDDEQPEQDSLDLGL